MSDKNGGCDHRFVFHVSLVCSLVGGIVAGAVWPASWAFLLPFAFAVRRSMAVSGLACLVGVVLGVSIGSAWNAVRSLAERGASISGSVVAVSPHPNGDSVLVLVQTVGPWAVGRGAIHSWLAITGAVQRGDRLVVACERWTVQERITVFAPTSPRLQCRQPRLERRQPAPVALLFFERARRRLVAGLQQALPEPAASLAVGFALGETESLPPDIVEAFRVTGTSHIMALSGYNVTLLTAVLLALLPGVLGRRSAFFVVALTLAGFLVLTGVPPSLLRATVMAGFLLFARIVGRRAPIGRLLALAVGLLVVVTPPLVFDLGFVLSVSATAGLVVLAERLATRFPLPSFLGQPLASTLAAIIATLPFLLPVFGRVSLVAPFANLAVLPLVPLLFFASVGVAGLAALSPLLAASVSTPVSWFADVFLTVVSWFADLPFASLTVYVPNIWPWAFPLVSLAIAFRVRSRPCRVCQCPEPSYV